MSEDTYPSKDWREYGASDARYETRIGTAETAESARERAAVRRARGDNENADYWEGYAAAVESETR